MATSRPDFSSPAESRKPNSDRLFTSTPVLLVALLTPKLRHGCTPGKTESVHTNGKAIFVLVALSSASHHQLQSLSSAKQNQNSEKSQQGTFFDAAEPVGNKHAALASITAEGARPTTPQNQQRSLPFSCFSFNNFIKRNRQNKYKRQSLSSVLRGAETSPGKSDLSMLSRCHGTNGSNSSFRMMGKVNFDVYVLFRR